MPSKQRYTTLMTTNDEDDEGSQQEAEFDEEDEEDDVEEGDDDDRRHLVRPTGDASHERGTPPPRPPRVKDTAPHATTTKPRTPREKNEDDPLVGREEEEGYDDVEEENDFFQSLFSRGGGGGDHGEGDDGRSSCAGCFRAINGFTILIITLIVLMVIAMFVSTSTTTTTPSPAPSSRGGSRTPRPANQPSVGDVEVHPDDDEAQSSSTPRPTMTLSPTRLPTAAPTESAMDDPDISTSSDDDSPVVDPRDKRYGPKHPYFTPPRVDFYYWSWESRRNFTIDQGKRRFNDSDDRNAPHVSFCNRHNAALELNAPTKYAFPAEKDPRPSNRLEELKRMRQFRAALLEYRLGEPGDDPFHRPSFDGGFLPLYYNGSSKVADYEATINRMAHTFRRLLTSHDPHDRRLIVGVMGTSVTSGQDNCYDTSYAPLLGRELRRLFGPLGLNVTVRGMGQNGDGPGTTLQAMCAPLTMCDPYLPGDTPHFIVTYYPMILHPAAFDWNYFFREMTSRGVVFNEIEEGGYMMSDLLAAGYRSSFAWLKEIPNPDSVHTEGWAEWSPSHFWGRRGDRWCHNRTREGESDVMMQNWHNGPLRVSQHVDQLMDLYAAAAARALESLVSARPLPPLAEVNREAPYPSEWNATCAASRPYQLVFPLRQYMCDQIDTRVARFYEPRVACLTSYGPQFSDAAKMVMPGVWWSDVKSTPFGIGLEVEDEETVGKSVIYRPDASVTLRRLKNPSGLGMNQETSMGLISYAGRQACFVHPDFTDGPSLRHSGGFKIIPALNATTSSLKDLKFVKDIVWFVFQLNPTSLRRLRERRDGSGDDGTDLGKRFDIWLCAGEHGYFNPLDQREYSLEFQVRKWDVGQSPPVKAEVVRYPTIDLPGETVWNHCGAFARGVPLPADEEERKATFYGFRLIHPVVNMTLEASRDWILPPITLNYHSLVFIGVD